MVMTKAHTKRKQDIKSKLMAAVAMLLVSSIMMVSSTYAWFTLSTAPEVTGITTAVGANGNLEMALIPNDPTALGMLDFGITSSAGDGALDSMVAKNVTWGNLVDLSTGYGLDQITLYPASLVTENGKVGSNFILATPEYAADGRMTDVVESAVAGTYSNGIFANGSGYGVRAVGTMSNVGPFELAYMNAAGKITSFANAAKNTAKASMGTYGTQLAGIAVEYATTENPSYTVEDVAALKGIVNAVSSALDSIEKGILQYILAETLADKNETVTETNFNEYVLAIEGATLADLDGTTINGKTFVVTANAQAAITKLTGAKANVAAAKTALNGLAAQGSYTWTDISGAMGQLANLDGMYITNDKGESKSINELREKEMAEIVGFVYYAKSMTMTSGSSIYADIADLPGDYKNAVDISAGGLIVGMEDLTKTVDMVAHSTLSDEVLEPDIDLEAGEGYLPNGKENLAEFTSGGSNNAVQPITDYYGYIIDLAFRTNASGSKLLLQSEAVDRIYAETEGGAAMGKGSYMEFTSSDPKYTAAQMQELLENVKVVFFDTLSRDILANGELAEIEEIEDANVTGYQEVETGGTGTHGLVVTTPAQYVELRTDEQQTYRGTRYEKVGTDYLESKNGTYKMTVAEKSEYKLLTDDSMTGYNGTQYVWHDAEAEGEKVTYAQVKASIVLSAESGYITELEQNVAKAVSVLVYLDGEGVTNADVSVSGKITGNINLQFASDANLVPMDYSDLKTAIKVDGVPGIAQYVEHEGVKYVVFVPTTPVADGQSITIDGVTATPGTVGGVTGWAKVVDNKPASITTAVTGTPSGGSGEPDAGGETT